MNKDTVDGILFGMMFTFGLWFGLMLTLPAH